MVIVQANARRPAATRGARSRKPSRVASTHRRIAPKRIPRKAVARTVSEWAGARPDRRAMSVRRNTRSIDRRIALTIPTTIAAKTACFVPVRTSREKSTRPRTFAATPTVNRTRAARVAYRTAWLQAGARLTGCSRTARISQRAGGHPAGPKGQQRQPVENRSVRSQPDRLVEKEEQHGQVGSRAQRFRQEARQHAQDGQRQDQAHRGGPRARRLRLQHRVEKRGHHEGRGHRPAEERDRGLQRPVLLHPHRRLALQGAHQQRQGRPQQGPEQDEASGFRHVVLERLPVLVPQCLDLHAVHHRSRCRHRRPARAAGCRRRARPGSSSRPPPPVSRASGPRRSFPARHSPAGPGSSSGPSAPGSRPRTGPRGRPQSAESPPSEVPPRSVDHGSAATARPCLPGRRGWRRGRPTVSRGPRATGRAGHGSAPRRSGSP